MRMSLRLNNATFQLQSPCLCLHGNLLTHGPRVWRRRRLKLERSFAHRYQLRSSLSASFENLFQNLISQFPSANSLDLIAPALGFASGAALYISHFKSHRNSGVSDIGEWILFTSPTPFNRFVLLRCPSIQFEGSELLQDVNDKLVKEDRHYVKLNSGKIHVRDSDKRHGRFEETLVYQRVCVSTDDGGVISLDWPANLDLTEEPGLDTTLLLVPGTTEGSMDKNVRSFVCQSLKHGCFPVVMNPRGCAGSPLTTARLFTAADSDDICTAIQFINSARPWTTLMGVGWGYGANMLTKYLAEVGERTPLTAATCIDNPFDLEEATRSSPYHIATDQKLAGGLIDILRSNKELFQGRAKGFSIEKALSATSVRDFEKAISMVSYGFEAIEEFYAKSSTRQLVGNVKIPLLFIQNDDGMVPVFSIPRSSIAENPFTSLLLCSCLPSATRHDISAISWCQHLAIEWLTAVELGLLKGRHPLLKDVDVSINPSKGLTLLEAKTSNKSRNKNDFLNLTHSDALNGYSIGPRKDVLDETDTAPRAHLRSGGDLERQSKFQDEKQKQLVNGAVSQKNSLIHAESVKEEGDDPVDSERGQVLQTANVVINMLDVTLPGTLAEEQKKKVLAAVEQGETVMKALQGAVPEDVRGKLTAAVTEIVQAQGTNLNLVELMMTGRNSSVSSEAKSKAHEKAGGPLSLEILSSSSNSSDLVKRADELTTASDNNQSGTEKLSGGTESELQPSSKSLKSVDLGQSQSASSHVDVPNSGKKDTFEEGQNHAKDELSKERSFAEYEETRLETGGNPNHHSRYEKASNTEEAFLEQGKVNQGNEVAHMGVKEVNDNRTTEDRSSDASADQSKQISSTKSEEASSFVTASPQPEPMENMGNDNQTNEEKNMQPMTDQNKQGCTKSEETSPSFLQAPNPPSLNVSQALDALTGLDDSTQMAVNSVFGVIEDMITQLEGKDDGNDGKEDKIEDMVGDENGKPGSASEQPSMSSEHKLEIEEYSEKGMKSDSNQLQSCDHPVDNSPEKCAEPHQDTRNGWDERKVTDNPSSLFKPSTSGSWGYCNGIDVHKENRMMKEDLTRSKILADNLDKSGLVHKFPLYVTINPYRDSLYSKYRNKYIISKMSNTTSLDLDTTTDLLLDYIPEEGQWKLLDRPGNARNFGVDQDIHSTLEAYDVEKIIEPSYVILDSKIEKQQIEEYETGEDFNKKAKIGSDISSEDLTQFIKSVILDSLKVEVGRKLGASTVKAMEYDLAQDLEQVANAVSLAIGQHGELIWSFASRDPASGTFGTLNGELIINTISSAVQDANYLGKVLPIGVIIGSSLAALRKHFNVATIDQAEVMGEKYYGQVGEIGNSHKPVEKKDQFSDIDGLPRRIEEKVEKVNLKNDTMMVGAVTAALGASALMVHQQEASESSSETTGISSSSLNVRGGGYEMEPDKLQEAMSEKNQNNLVTCLAEKAMSVAGPVVPTKNDGEVDQERLVAMLADLGQKGGMLRLIGKIALLWGGIRGAMSLTERLISFLRLAERPLVQRILGFVCMVLVLWSPVVVPLLPTLVLGWAAHNPNGIARYACIIGFYIAVLILIMLWGKRVRGYGNPLEQYGLDLTSLQKLYDCLKGLMVGVMLVLSIHSVNVLLGWACLSWPSSLPSSSAGAVAWLKVCGGVFVLTGQGIMAAIGIAIAEELLFRSWLPEEISVDLGYHQAIIISGLTFSILQRSTHAIPGLWLLSLALSGIRQRSNGSLSIPIGMRAGIIATNFILQKGGFLAYKGSGSLWLTGSHPFQPFSGAVGLAMSLLLAIALYPQSLYRGRKLQEPFENRLDKARSS